MTNKSVQSISIAVGALSSTNTPLFKVPAGHGGITITKAYIIAGAAATAALQLNNNGTTLGTAITATIGTLASATLTAATPKEITVSTAYQDAGTWIAIAAVSGAGVTVTNINIEYVFGK